MGPTQKDQIGDASSAPQPLANPSATSKLMTKFRPARRAQKAYAAEEEPVSTPNATIG